MKKVFFSIKLDKYNLKLRSHLLKIIKKYKNPNKSSLLDIGCGNGRFAALLKNKIKSYYGIDPDKDYIKFAKNKIKSKNIKFSLGKAEKIPSKDKFDIILYSFSWHYIENYKEALKELKRVSKKDSLIIIFEPPFKPKGYKDSRLNKDSPNFDKKMFLRKLNILKMAKREMLKQKTFKILEHQSFGTEAWILKNKEK